MLELYKTQIIKNKHKYQVVFPARMSLFNIFKKDEQSQRQKISKKVKESSFYSQSSPTLPQNFAQSVMQLQMQLQFIQSYDMQVVHKLNEMYRIAIEHYINFDPRKANHFQRKLTSLLTDPHTLQIMEKTEKSKSNLVKQKPLVNTAHYNTQLKQELNRFNSQSEIMVKSIIQGSHKKVERSSKIISHNLNNQEDMLQRRLLARSKSRSRNKTQTHKSPLKSQLSPN